MNFFDHKDLGNHLLQLCPKVVKHPVYGSSLALIIIIKRKANDNFRKVAILLFYTTKKKY